MATIINILHKRIMLSPLTFSLIKEPADLKTQTNFSEVNGMASQRRKTGSHNVNLKKETHAQVPESLVTQVYNSLKKHDLRLRRHNLSRLNLIH